MKSLGLAALAFLITAGASAVEQSPAPADNPMSAVKVALGRRLFYDADLSIDGTMACATCHEQHRGFADGNATHAGVHGDPGRRNVPGLANVSSRKSLTWGDPRVTTLEAQVAIPLLGHDPVEMGMAGMEAELARRLGRDACYTRMFRAAFPEVDGRIDLATVAKALAAFQRTMISRDAPVDHGAAVPAAFDAKCASCHSGGDFTDDQFHRLRSSPGEDRGLGQITDNVSDDGAFRTPSLRNVAVTGPWLHDGSAQTLAAAISAHPDSKPADLPTLVAFLDSLTDRSFLTNPAFAYPDGICQRQ